LGAHATRPETLSGTDKILLVTAGHGGGLSALRRQTRAQPTSARRQVVSGAEGDVGSLMHASCETISIRADAYSSIAETSSHARIGLCNRWPCTIEP